jgi:hypothetical protein
MSNDPNLNSGSGGHTIAKQSRGVVRDFGSGELVDVGPVGQDKRESVDEPATGDRLAERADRMSTPGGNPDNAEKRTPDAETT